MKKRFKIVQAVIILCLFFCSLLPVNYIKASNINNSEFVELPTKTNVSKYRNWVIRFNLEVNPKCIDNKNIKVIDSNSIEQIVNLSVGSDNKSVTINCPQNGYNLGQTYYVIISNKVYSSSNEFINKATKMKFVVSNDNDISNINPVKFSSNVVQINSIESQSIEDHTVDEKENGNNKVVTLDNNNTYLSSLKKGDVFFSEPTKNNPFGNSGKILSNNEVDGKSQIEIAQPKLDEVISEADFHVEKSLKKGDLISSTFPEGTTINFNNNSVFEKNKILERRRLSGVSLESDDINIKLPERDHDFHGIKLSNIPTITLKKPKIIASIDLKKDGSVPVGINNFEARLITTLECEDKVNINGSGEIKDVEGGYNNKNDGLTGVNMSDKILLGSMTYMIGGMAVKEIGGIKKEVPLGATIFLYLTYGGKVEANVNFDVKESCYIDKGVNYNGVSSNNHNIDKSTTSVSLNGNFDGQASAGVGAGLGIVVLGMVPVDVTSELDCDVNGSAQGSIDFISGKHTGNLNIDAALKLRCEGNCEFGFENKSDPVISLKVPITDLTLLEWKYPDKYIKNIDDINAEVKRGDKYTLPDNVTATYNDGSSKLLPVVWDKNEVDTSIDGLQSYEGTVEGYDKKVKLNLTVTEDGNWNNNGSNTDDKSPCKYASAGGFSFVIKENGSLWMLGSNYFGPFLGNAERFPRKMDGSWSTISVNAFDDIGHAVGIKSDGSLWAVGLNFFGDLGDGNEADKSTGHFVRIGSDNDWKEVSVNNNDSFAIKKDGSLWAWGDDQFGALGDGNEGHKVVPTRIGNDNDWKQISAGSSYTLGIKSDGSLWAWGENNAAQLGDGTNVTRMVPIRIGNDNDWKLACAGVDSSGAIKKDGSLWTWGWNNGHEKAAKVPTRLGNNNDWTEVSNTSGYYLALKKDGSLWSWGVNRFGVLGNGSDCLSNNAPTQVGNDKDWIYASAGGDVSIGIKTDGSLWAWGRNLYGLVGDGTNIDRYVPTRAKIN